MLASSSWGLKVLLSAWYLIFERHKFEIGRTQRQQEITWYVREGLFRVEGGWNR